MPPTSAPPKQAIYKQRNTLKPLSAELSCLDRADGSCQYRSGDTLILAGMYGPCPPKSPAKEHALRGTLFVVFQWGTKHEMQHASDSTTSHQENRAHAGFAAAKQMKSREIEHFLESTLSQALHLEQHPRTVIELVVQVVQHDGGIVSAALNAAVLAILDAGSVDVRYVPVGGTCLVQSRWGVVGTEEQSKTDTEGDVMMKQEEDEDNNVDNDEGALTQRVESSLILDPSLAEEQGSEVVIQTPQTTDRHAAQAPTTLCSVVAVTTTSKTLSKNKNNDKDAVLASMTYGPPPASAGTKAPPHMPPNAYISAVEQCRVANTATAEFMRLAVEKKVQGQAETLFAG